jgi:hypothetical protein
MKLVAFAFLTGLSVMSVSSAHAQEMSPIEWGIDRPGNDILLVSLPRFDPNLCRDECAVHDQCVAWTFVFFLNGRNNECYLKDAAPAPVSLGGAASGVKTVLGGP